MRRAERWDWVCEVGSSRRRVGDLYCSVALQQDWAGRRVVRGDDASHEWNETMSLAAYMIVPQRCNDTAWVRRCAGH